MNAPTYRPQNPKIDLLYWANGFWNYSCSTHWYKTCKDAKANVQKQSPSFKWKAKKRKC